MAFHPTTQDQKTSGNRIAAERHSVKTDNSETSCQKMSSKTPVSTLHEMFVCKGITPYYQLVVNGVGTHNPIFKYQLECGNERSEGIGKSKKEAKHDAARNLLNQLRNSGISPTEADRTENLGIDEGNNITVTSPYEDVVKKNVVGALTTLCTSNRISEPVFELIGEEGLPHSKTFTMRCSVLHLREDAEARTKKQAKHKSAQQMINKLQEYFNNCLDFAALEEEDDTNPDTTKQFDRANLQNETDKNIDEIKNKYIAMQRNRTLPENLGLKISDYHTISTDINCFLTHLNFEKMKYVKLEAMDDPFSFLVSLFEGMDMEIESEDLPSRDQSVKCKALIVHTLPSWCCVGTGGTEEEALKNSALKMLNFFKKLKS